MPITTKFADSGTTVHVISFDDDTIRPELRPAVYSVGYSMMGGFFLNKKSDKLSEPERIYGAVDRRVNKVLNTYRSSTSSFGVLMSGDKGSGKTMTSSIIANRAMEELNLPVVLVEDSFDASGLASFIERLGECVVFFDEFAKRYDGSNEEQGSLLSLFDGTGSTRRLIMMTENNKSDINRYMLNRPGRIYYHFEYGRIEEETIKEYCTEQGIEDNVVEQICLRREKSREFSFDILQAIVREYKLYGTDIETLCEDLNVENIVIYERPKMELIEATYVETGEEVKFIPRDWDFPSPRRDVTMLIDDRVGAEDEDDDDRTYAMFSAPRLEVDMKEMIRKEGDIYTFKTKVDESGKEILLRVCKVTPSYSAY